MSEPLTKEQRSNLMLWVEQHPEVLDYKVNLRQYEATVQRLEAQLASERQAHSIMDAAYWAAKEREADQTAALGALAEAARALMASHAGLGFNEPKQGEPHTGWDLQQALLPDAVQKAVEVAKAKDTEIERLQLNLKQTDEANVMLKLERTTLEAKLAVATGLLRRSANSTEYDSLENDIEAFLADPSQAEAQDAPTGGVADVEAQP